MSSPTPSRGRGLEVLEGSYRLFFVAEKQADALRTRRWNPVAPLGACRFSVLPPKRLQVCCAPTNLRFCPLGQLWNSKYFQQIQQFITKVFLILLLPFLATPQNFFFFFFSQLRLQFFCRVQTTDVSPETENKHLQSRLLPSRKKTQQKHQPKNKNRKTLCCLF